MEASNNVELNDVTKYFGNFKALKNVFFNVKKREIMALVGPNGSGKTTLMRILAGLYSVDKGNGYILNFPLDASNRNLQRSIGYMAQAAGVYDKLTVKQNLEFYARSYRIDCVKDSVAEMIEKFYLTKIQHKEVSKLSGGMRQRVALACAVIHKPKLLLLDEPSAGIDPKARRKLWSMIREIALEGTSIVVSTHHMDEAERCDRICLLIYSEVVDIGTFEELIENSGIMTWMVSGQRIDYIYEQITNKSEIEQVVHYGTYLHISSHDASKLAKALFPFIKETLEPWRLIKPDLEDICVAKMSMVDRGEE